MPDDPKCELKLYGRGVFSDSDVAIRRHSDHVPIWSGSIDMLWEMVEKLQTESEMYNRVSTYWWREWRFASGRKRPVATDAGVNEACQRMDAQDRETERLQQKLNAANARMAYIEGHITRAEQHAKDQVVLRGKQTWIGRQDALRECIEELNRYDAAMAEKGGE